METIKNLQLAWENDSFYMQTTSRNGASILRAGAVGFLASRISGIGLPKNEAVRSIIFEITNIFLKFVEKKIIEKYLPSNKDDEIFLRSFLRLFLCENFTRKVCSLMGKKVVIFPLRELLFSQKTRVDFIKDLFAKYVIETTIDFTTSLVFPTPREAC
ncbi:MAG: hypothetical protein ACRDAI_03700 [Candidatus Rhabdochlamydia sp.]